MHWFQSTRPHGARPGMPWQCLLLLWFQSTRPHGARHKEINKEKEPKSFNPRAHTGRDFALKDAKYHRFGFQSTRPHGARLQSHKYSGANIVFQSTRPHGARLKTAVAAVIKQKFQSTRPHGARHLGGYSSDLNISVSIHAPTRGATVYSANA